MRSGFGINGSTIQETAISKLYMKAHQKEHRRNFAFICYNPFDSARSLPMTERNGILWVTYSFLSCRTNNHLFQEGAEMSVYQYNSFLGSAFFTSFVVFFIQIMVPFLILVYAVRMSNRFPLWLWSNNIFNIEMGNNGPTTSGNIPANVNLTVIYSTDLTSVFWTTWDIFCSQTVA